VTPDTAPALDAADGNTAVALEYLRRLDAHLETLSPEQVATLLERGGESALLRHAQGLVRTRESALLDSLPVQIALLDRHGVIVSVNQTWRQAAHEGELRTPHYGVGSDYVGVCERVEGHDAAEARRVGEAIRTVLAGHVSNFTLEYPCHSREAQRWYLLNVTPIAAGEIPGAVVMHMDITERREAQRRVTDLSRMHAMLSGISNLIVRVRSRETLFQEACRVAAEAGGFVCARMDILDPRAMRLHHAGFDCRDQRLRGTIERVLAADGGVPSPIVSQAITGRVAMVANDAESDPRTGALGKHRQVGIGSKAVIPIFLDGAVFGVMVFYAEQRQFFHDEELQLLGQLGREISFAIEHIDKSDRLQQYAYYDALTGLANRALFLERTEQCIRTAAGAGHLLAVAVVDLERFEVVNDSHGRSVGDDLLRQVADWLAFLIGDAFRLARVDADHFALMFPEVKDEEEVAMKLNRFMTAFLDHPFQLTDEADFRVIARAGAALFPADGSSAESLYRNAEAALRKAKAVGDPYLFYTRHMTEAAASKLSLESRLRQALERQEFVLHYQPKISFVDGHLTGAEALIRWQDPRSALVSPATFIPLLEETGLICEVGRWALAHALEDYLRWRRAGLPAPPIAVNVSAVQLRDPMFVQQIRQLLCLDPLAAAGLELEITESVIMEDINHGISHLQSIRDLGIPIMIDDFGTGFSSLSYLSRLPVDALKIDRSFVAELSQASRSSALVSTIIHLAHSLELKVVAEGVETELQSTILRSLGCDQAQGFLFSRPLSAESFEQQLRAADRPGTDRPEAARAATP
jgi:diguanylate cyclase (GGDEF)-like protein